MRGRPLCLFCLFFLIIQMIFIRGFQVGRDLKPSLLEKNVEEGTQLTVTGKVYHTEVKKDYLVVYLTTKSYQTKIIAYIKQTISEQICIGNTIQVNGEISYFDAPRNPGNFDQHFYYQKQGIHGCIWANSCEVTDTSQNVWKESLAQLRIRWKNLLIEQLGTENGNTMSAILLGDKSELDSDLKELYQKNGIGHILAISGLHMTFIGLGFYKILRKRGLSFVSAGLIGILFLVSYSMMIGNGVASVRALVMFIIRIGADMTGRVYDMLTALAVAAIVILVWRPLYLYDAGFLLSFGAILGILIVYPIMDKTTEKDTSIIIKQIEKVRLGLCGSISINLAILPCMLYFYFEFPPYSVFVNLLVIPLMSVVLGAGVIGSFVCSVIPFVGDKILWICKPVLFLYEWLCDLCIRLPGSHLVVGQPKMWQVIMYYLLLGIALVLMRRYMTFQQQSDEKDEEIHNNQVNSARCRKLCSVAGTLIVSAMVILCVRFDNLMNIKGDISVTMLDVGQGDGLVIRGSDDFTCMVDGGSSDVSEVGKYRIEPYLKSQGISTLDYVFVSHGDMDHYSGIEELLARQQVGIRIRYLVLPAEEVLDDKLISLANLAVANETHVVTIVPGQSVCGKNSKWHQANWANMQLTCLQPDRNYSGEIGNASSMVLTLSYGEFDMLFTGDVESEGEALLERVLQNYDDAARYEVLKVAHHGSKNSSSAELLEIIKPKLSLISAGQENRYGHPHTETIERLEAVESEILSTQACGAITIKSDGKTMTVSRYIKEDE